MDVRKLGLSDEDLKALGYKVPTRESGGIEGSTAPSVGPSSASGGGTRPRFGGWLWTLVALLVVGWVALPTQRMPRPVPANQPDSVFSSGRAMSQLVEIARAPRPVGSPEHRRVRSYLMDRLAALGMEVQLQSATAVVTDTTGAVAAALGNVLARRPGASSTGTMLLVAHYDGTPLSWGAGDNGIGLAAVLETVRALTARESLRNDLVILFSDGKELGSLGAEVFLESHPWASDVRAAVAVDAQGVSGPVFLVEGPTDGIHLAEAAGSLADPSVFSALQAMPGGAQADMELRTLAGGGIPGVGLVALGGRHAHERPQDRPINVSETTLQHAGAQLLALTGWLGQEELDEVAGPAGDAAGYVTLPALGLVAYPDAVRVPATIGLVVIFLILLALVRARGDGPMGVLAGVALGVLAVAVSAGLGSVLQSMLPALHPEVGHLETAVYEEGLLEVALLGAVLGVLMTGYALARRRYPRHELLVGAVVPPVLTVVGLTLTLPEALPLVQAPMLLTLLATLLALLLPGQLLRRGGRAVAVIMTWGVLLLAVPGVFLVTSTFTLLDAPWIAVWMALAALLMLPVAEWLMHPSPWAAPALSGLVTVVALTLAVPGVGGEERHPVPTSLALLVDDTMQLAPPGRPAAEPTPAREASTPIPEAAGQLRTRAPDSTVLAAQEDSVGRWMPGLWLTVPGTGETWVSSWVVDATARGMPAGPLLLPASDRWIVAGSGPETFLPAPSMEAFILDPEDSSAGSSGVAARRVRLVLRPGLDAEMAALRLVDPSSGSFTAADGVPVQGRAGVSIPTISLWGRPESGAWIVDVQVTDVDSPLVLDIIEHHLRPRVILGERFFQRADSVAADASTGSDRLIQRVRVRLPTS